MSPKINRKADTTQDSWGVFDAKGFRVDSFKTRPQAERLARKLTRQDGEKYTVKAIG